MLRAGFDAAVAQLRCCGQRAGAGELRAAVTVGSSKQSWIGQSMKWVQFGRLDLAWWRLPVWPGRVCFWHSLSAGALRERVAVYA
eukprot:2982561-Rhodomonas_salina.2